MTFGFLLGVKHATDADHILALATIATRRAGARTGAWVGVSWGIGHSATLLRLGIVVLLSKEALLPRFDEIAHLLEVPVSLTLICLGAIALFQAFPTAGYRKHLWKTARSVHPDGRAKLGSSTSSGGSRSRYSGEGSAGRVGHNRFRRRSLAVGAVHDLDGGGG